MKPVSNTTARDTNGAAGNPEGCISMKPTQMKTTERVKHYAQMLPEGSEVTANKVCRDIGTRGITDRVVSTVFRSMDIMEFVPVHRIDSGKWRRK